MPASLRLDALPNLPLIKSGDDLAALLAASLAELDLQPQNGDVLVVAQKIVSKAEGRYRDLSRVKPSETAVRLAGITGKDQRLVECILQESRRVLRAVPGVLIVEHRLGFILANAGIDQSNIPEPGRVLLLPENPDSSARLLRSALRRSCCCDLAVIVNDSWGRPWRNGVVGFAVGSAGIEALSDRVGTVDLFNRQLQVTEVALADELAASASLIMGQAAEGYPAVLIRGMNIESPPIDPGTAPILREAQRDLFR